VAEFLGTLLLERYPQLLTARYGFKTESMDGVGVIEGVALEQHRIAMEEKARLAEEKAARKAEEAARGKRGT
jgi:ribosome biogenesis GTPase A